MIALYVGDYFVNHPASAASHFKKYLWNKKSLAKVTYIFKPFCINALKQESTFFHRKTERKLKIFPDLKHFWELWQVCSCWNRGHALHFYAEKCVRKHVLEKILTIYSLFWQSWRLSKRFKNWYCFTGLLSHLQA